MTLINAVINWRRFLKRRNCSPNTIKNYLNAIKSFVVWLGIPLENVIHATVSHYIDYLMRKRLEPKTINCHLNSIRQFYHYLIEEEHLAITNPIRKNHTLRMARPLPRHLKDDQVETFFKVVKGHRDRAMFMLMIRCGLRVEEVANLSFDALDFKHRKILIKDGKGSKDRIVYMSNDAIQALTDYLKARPSVSSKKVFWWEKVLPLGIPSPFRAFKNVWNITPAKGSSTSPAIISGTRWLHRC